MSTKTIQLKPKIHQKLKIRAVKNESTMQDELDKILEKELSGENNG